MINQSIRTAATFRATAEAWETVDKADIVAAVARHVAHDWADQSPMTAKKNEEALKGNGRLFSVHVDRNKVKFFVISSPEFTYPLVSVSKRK